MKVNINAFKWIVLLMLTVINIACSSDEDYYIKVDEGPIYCDFRGSPYHGHYSPKILVQSNVNLVQSNEKCYISCSESWLTAELVWERGNHIIFTISRNPENKERKAIVTLSYKDIIATTTIIQTENYTKDHYFNVSNDYVKLDYETGSEASITTSISLNTYNTQYSCSWLSVRKAEGTYSTYYENGTPYQKLYFEATSENSGTEERTAVVELVPTTIDFQEEGSFIRTITVVQKPRFQKDPFNLCPDDNHPHAIDMGTGVKFACCNVGSDIPLGSGDFFAWGETESKYWYNWETYKWSNGRSSDILKYCNNPRDGKVDLKTVLDNTDDAAFINWGSSWRMPSENDFANLITQCTWKWEKIGGVEGFKIVSSNGNVLFLPATGYFHIDRLYDGGETGSYWLSDLAAERSTDAKCLCIRKYKYTDDGSPVVNPNKEIYNNSRDLGCSIRPVKQ